MCRNLAPRDLERDVLPAPAHGQSDLGAGTALDAADHAVLRELHAGDVGRVDLEEPVPRTEPDFLGRPAGNHLYHHCRVIRDIELYPDAVEVAGKAFLRGFQSLRQHIYGMRVQRREGGCGHLIRHFLVVDVVHIILVYALEHQVDFPPVRAARIQTVRPPGDALHGKRPEHPHCHPEQSHDYR